MDVIGSAGNRRTKIAFGDIPVSNAILRLQQCSIQRFHRFGIPEIDRIATAGMRHDEGCEFRGCSYELNEIVTFAVAIAWMRPTRSMDRFCSQFCGIHLRTVCGRKMADLNSSHHNQSMRRTMKNTRNVDIRIDKQWNLA